MKKIKNSLPSLFQVVLIVWLIFSASYIVHDLWKNGLSATYQAGYQRAFADVIQSSQTCQPFNVFVGEAKVDLISMQCLEAAAQQAQAPQPAPDKNEALVEDEG